MFLDKFSNGSGDADYFELIFRDREICEPSAFILEVEKSPLSSHLIWGELYFTTMTSAHV